MRRKKHFEGWAAIVAFAVSVATLIGLLSGGFERIARASSSWIRKEPRLVIRRQVTSEDTNGIRYDMTFSIFNRRAGPITLNSVSLRLGDYTFGSSIPGPMWIAYKRFSKDIKVTFVGHAGGRAFPVLRRQESEESMGSMVFNLLDSRGSMEAHEQIDFDLSVALSCPSTLKGNYPNLWSLGGQIEVEYEDEPSKAGVLRCPASRDRPLPF